MKVTYYGHSCFELNISGKALLLDPFITPNPKAKDIKIESIKPDFMLISHGHGDHIADAVTIAHQSSPVVVSNYEIITWLEKQGVENGKGCNHGGTFKFDFGSVKYVNAIHSSSLPDGSYGGNPGGFVIKSSDKNIYYAGDTALTMDMKLIAEETKIDVAFLPIGDCFTMGIDDAIKAADFVKCDKIIGMHYDTFPPIEIDKADAVKRFKEKGKELILINIGESIEI